MNDTKQKILDTAERLFADHGYSATSLRHIIAEAGVNLAAIHYHFGSKQDLLDQLILRKAGPMNERRLKLLDQFIGEAAPAPPTVEKIMEALIVPAVLMEKSPEFVKLTGRMLAEGLMPEVAQRHFLPMITRFMAALHDALQATGPQLNTPLPTLKRTLTTIPIVMAFSIDPVGNGLVASLARPGANTTGVSCITTELSGKRVAIFHHI